MSRLSAVVVVLFVASLVCGAPPGGDADLEVEIVPPSSSTAPYQTARYEVTVNNIGSRTANSVSLTIHLPETNTSPTAHLLGTLAGVSSECAIVGETQIACNLGRIRSRRSATVHFDIAFPHSTAAIEIVAAAETSSSESALANNEYVHLVQLDPWVAIIDPPAGVTNSHCTGRDLTSYFECTLYPSSILSHDIQLETNGEITFPPDQTGYTGTWSQPTTSELQFEYRYNNIVRLQFSGVAVSADCFEGVATFPGSPYVAPYHSCFREL